MDKDLGIVLAGGGVRGVAHIGLLKALHEYGLRPTHISGCSSGAIVGCLYAAGCDTEQMLDYFDMHANIFSLNKISIKRGGIFNSEKYISTLDDIITKDDFKDLHVKLIVNATDIVNGEIVYFDQGDVKRKVIASAAVPGIFSPIIIDNSVYVDGGTMDNFPVQPLLNKNMTIIGSFISMHKKIELKDISSSLKLVNRASQLAFNSGTLPKLSLCDHIIAPEILSNYSLFDTKKMNEIFEIGYQETLKYLASNEELVTDYSRT